MRILHTSDWHLGRSFHGAGLLAAQGHFIDRLIETVLEHRVDLVLISGDVYDRALPNVDAVALFDTALGRLRAAGAAVVATSGNHDSALRLGFGSSLMEAAGVFLRTRIEDLDVPAVFAADGFELLVYGLPYLEPRMVAEALGVTEPGHPPVIRAALERVRADWAERRAAADRPVHAIVMAHVFAAGGEPAESERALSIGGLDIVPVPYFTDFDYAALGHLHGRQKLADNVRYSGSPIPYSFSEAGHTKGALLLEFDADGLGEVQPIDWPAAKPLAVLRGHLEELLADPDLAPAEAAWCQITLTDTDRPAAAIERLRTRFPDTLALNFEPEGRAEPQHASYGERLAAAATPLQVCAGFVDHVRQRPADAAETALLERVLADATAAAVTR
ncbi:exonuclease SbcCD subunit D [Paeniglutamicibacter cryotolerans]|uniref:Nuclease SbcCD subunit D n=1 Tax=Paeniglutamicibacter cryotolerans TaxID=670079 RepID=A0A839QNR8_9MICC|nr:exonuclease SbcCD subunit D [Paeniglutamicibacter cryotolerans]MBB2996424.1 exonuclease SbcD [Paeniglutamicibacter cryotolerans]